MSLENVELVRALYEARDSADRSAALTALDPEIVWISSPGAVPRRGVGEFVRSLAEWEQMWASYESLVEEYVDAGDRVVVVSRLQARGEQSGVEVDAQIATSWTVRDAKLTRGEVFDSKDDALASIGLNAEAADIAARARALYAAYNRRDWDAVFENVDPALEWDPVEEGVVFRGRSEWVAGAENWLATWAEWQWEPDEIEVDRSGRHAFVALRSWGRSRWSDAVIRGRFFHVWTLRDGRLWKCAEYTERAEALADFEGTA